MEIMVPRLTETDLNLPATDYSICVRLCVYTSTFKELITIMKCSGGKFCIALVFAKFALDSFLYCLLIGNVRSVRPSVRR